MLFKNVFGFCSKVRLGKENEEKNRLYDRIIIKKIVLKNFIIY